MATVTKTWVFASDAEGLADAGNSANVTFSYDGADGSPDNGCVQFVCASSGAEYARRASTGQTWETWGVPAGTAVTSVQITAWKEKGPQPTVEGEYFKARIIGSGGTSVHGSGELLSTSINVFMGGWASGAAGVSQNVTAGNQASTTDVRLEFEVNLPSAKTWKVDTLELTMTYSAVPVSIETTLDNIAVITSTPTVLWGFVEGSDTLGPRECEVRLYQNGAVASAKRTLLALDNLLDRIEFEILERGGCGAGSLSMLATWNELGLSGNERADIYLWGLPAYRGRVLVNERDLSGDAERANLRLYGLMEEFDHWIVRRAFTYGSGDCAADISTVFSDLVNHAAIVTGRVPDATLVVETIGVNIQSFDARGSSLASAINKLLDMAANTAIWGCDFNTLADWRGIRQDRIYLRKRNTTCTSVFSIGDTVTAYSYPQDISKVTNKLILTGGAVTQPNLVTNGGFENVVTASADVGNLLLNSSFEDDSAWQDITGDATIQYPGNTGAFGSARSGTRWLECDRDGEGVYQDVTPVAGKSYVASTWARREDAEHANSFTMSLVGYDVSNNVVVTTTMIDAVPDDTYRKFSGSPIDLTVFPTVVRLRIIIQSEGGSASNDGVLFDDVGVYEDCGEAQEPWQVHPTGAAKIEELDWAYGTEDCIADSVAAPHAGGLCAKMRCSGIGVSADTGEIWTKGSTAPTVQPSERYTLLLFWHVDGAGTSSDEALSIGAQNVKSDNTDGTTIDSRDTVGVTRGNPSTWQMISVPIITDGTAVRLRPFIRVRTNRTIYLDDMMLVQGEVPDDVLDYNSWWSGSQFEAEIDVTDANLTDLSAAAQASITNYGQREAVVNVPEVTDFESLLVYANAYFNAHATPEIIGGLSVEGPTELLDQDGTVRLVNLPSGPEELFPSRVRYDIGETMRLQADLGKEQPDMADLLNLTAARASV